MKAIMIKSKSCKELNNEEYHLIQNDIDLKDIMNYAGIAEEYKSDITGCIFKVDLSAADYSEIWFTEDSAYYDLSATYYPADYYIIEDI